MERKKNSGIKNEIMNQGTFTHFVSIPLIESALKGRLKELQSRIMGLFTEDEQKMMEINNPDLFHITLHMLCLPKDKHKEEAQEIMKSKCEEIVKTLDNTKLTINLGKVLTFSRKFTNEGFQKPSGKHQKSFTNPQTQKNLIYLDIKDDPNLKKIMKISHILIKEFIERDIIDTSDLKPMKVIYDHGSGLFRADKYHITLFRVDSTIDLERINREFDGSEFGSVDCNSIDVSTRFSYNEEKFYSPLYRIPLP